MDEISSKVGGSSKEDNIEVSRVEEVEMQKVESKDEVKKDHSTLLEPKYQFRHKKRMGSSLIISKNNYHLLTKGKSIHRYNPKTGEAMSIRVLVPLKEKSSEVHENQGAKGEEEKGTLMEESKDDPKIDKTEEVCCNGLKAQEQLLSAHTTSSAKLIKNSYGTSTRKISQRLQRKEKRKERIKRSNSPYSHSNHVFGCRSPCEEIISARTYPPTNSHAQSRAQCGMKRKQNFLQSFKQS